MALPILRRRAPKPQVLDVQSIEDAAIKKAIDAVAGAFLAEQHVSKSFLAGNAAQMPGTSWSNQGSINNRLIGRVTRNLAQSFQRAPEDLELALAEQGLCYSNDTEVLTESGWKRFAEVDIRSDRFATRNPKTKEFEWQDATHFHHYAPEPMYHFTDRSLDVLVTGKHRMLVAVREGRHGEWHEEVRTAQELAALIGDGPSGNIRIPQTSVWGAPDLQEFCVGEPLLAPECVNCGYGRVHCDDRCATCWNYRDKHNGVERSQELIATARQRMGTGARPLVAVPKARGGGARGLQFRMSGDDFAAFMGMWLAEGSIVKGRKIRVAQQSFSKGWDPYLSLLQRILGRTPYYDGRSWEFSSAPLARYLVPLGHAKDKFIPPEVKNLSARQLEIFWEFYRLGDGSTEPSGRTRIVTASKRMADDLQEVAQKIGLSASVRGHDVAESIMRDGRRIRSGYIWAVTLRTTERYGFRVERVAPCGDVFCVAVPNETLYVRRNGYPTWSCNSWGPPFPPGRPLDPFYGYKRPPRTWDYSVGENVQLTPRWNRISFPTLKAIIDSYYAAQICVVPGTLIFTEYGAVPIEDITVGTKVLTHKDRWCRVSATMVNPVGSREVYRVVPEGQPALMLTGEHPVYALLCEYDPETQDWELGALDWVEARNLLPQPSDDAKSSYHCTVLPEDAALDLDSRYCPILSVEPVQYAGLVYNLEVEADNSYATFSGIVHNCVRHLINDCRSLEYQFVPPQNVQEDATDDIEKAEAFFRYPDRRQPFRAWLAEYLQDVLRYDAGTLYVRRNEAGDPIALEVVSGSSIIPLIDFFGRVAMDEDDDGKVAATIAEIGGTWEGNTVPAYLQIIEGMPWVWLTGDDIIYQLWNPLPESQYGLAPMEAVLMQANTDIRFQYSFLQYFCYDDATEILTKDGWRNFADLDGSEEFATRSASGQLEWQHTKDGTVHRFDYDGELVAFRNQCVDQVVTPNHRMLVRRIPDGTSENDWHIRRADYFVEHPTAEFQIPVTTNKWEGERPEIFTLPAVVSARPHRAHIAASVFLSKLLADGPIRAADGIAACRGAGLGPKAIAAGRQALGIASECRGVPGRKCGLEWWWLEPTIETPSSPDTVRYQPSRGLEMDAEAWARFLGFWIAEGSIRTSRGTISVCQSSTSVRLPAVEAVLDATRLVWTRLPSEDGMIRWETAHRVLCDYLEESCGTSAPIKRVPRHMLDWDRQLLAALLDGLMLGDGHIMPSGQSVYTTTSPVLADQVQEIWQKLGGHASVNRMEPDQRTWAKLPQYKVRNRPEVAFRVPRPSLVPYQGVVSCVSVPNGIVYVRRNGKPAWSGNTEGSIPAGFMQAPPDLSDPNQIAEWQDVWDAIMLGDQSKLRQIRWVPHGADFQAIKDEKFDSTFPLYLMRCTAAAFGVTPNDLGFTEDSNRSTGSVQVDVQFRVGTMPIIRHVEDLINSFIAEQLHLKARIQFDIGREVEDRLGTAQAEDIYIKNGTLSPDEVRMRLGKRVSRDRPTPRLIDNVRSGPIPLLALDSVAGKIDPTTFGPAKEQQLLDHPYVPAPGTTPIPKSPNASAATAASINMQDNSYVQNADPKAPKQLLLPDGTKQKKPNVKPAKPVPPAPPALPPAPVAPVAATKALADAMDIIGTLLGEMEKGDISTDNTGGPGVTRGFSNPTTRDNPGLKDSGAGVGTGAGGQGLTVATGIQGSDLIGSEGDEDALEEKAEQERQLRQWKENAKNRTKKGLAPRRFDDVPKPIADRVWANLEGARTVSEVNAAFAAVGKAPAR